MAAYGPDNDPKVWCASATVGYWEGQSLTSDAEISEQLLDTFGFSRCQIRYNRTTPTGFREDVMVTHIDWVSIQGAVCIPLGATAQAEMETALNTFHDNVAGLFPSSHTAVEYIWFNYVPIQNRPGPAERRTTTAKTGSATSSRMPDQLAITTTYQTCSRKHWGRSYWPMGAVANLDTTYGRVSNTRCDTLANHMDTLLKENGTDNTITPVVASIAYQAVLNIVELDVDNIFDVVRRRRAKFPSYRSEKTEA